jgi:iron complex outermembrane receptor protein
MNRNHLSAAIALTLCLSAGVAAAQDNSAQATPAAAVPAPRATVSSTSNTTNDNATRRAVQQMSAVQVQGNSLSLGGGLMSVQTAPKAVSTITRDAIVQAAPGATFVQMIASIPGVKAATDDVTGLNDGNFTIRGYTSDEVGITVNGAPINDSGNYRVYSTEYGDTENMGDITVQQGYPDVDTPVSGAAGGSIAWVTIDPSHTAGVDFSQSVGSDDYRRSFVRFNTGDTGPVRSWLSYSNNSVDMWRGAGQANVTKVDGKSIWTIDDKNSISASLQYNREVKDSYLSLTKTQAAQNYNQSYNEVYNPNGSASSNTNYYKLHDNPFTSALFSLDGEFALSDNLRLSVVPYFQYGSGGGSSATTFAETTSDANLYKATNQDLNGNGALGGSALAYSFSYSYTYRPGVIAKLNEDFGENNSLEYGFWYDSARQQQGQVFTPVSANGTPADIWGQTDLIRYPNGQVQKAYDQYTNTDTRKVFATDTWTPNDKWTITAGLAYLWVERDGYMFENPGSTGSINSSGVITAANSAFGGNARATYHKFTPTGGVKYQLNDENQFYFGAGKTFRAPVNAAILSNAYASTANSVINKPESAVTVDLGWRFYGERFSANIDAYGSNFNNKQVSGFDQNTGLTIYTSLPKVHMRGLNSESSFKLDDNWSVYGSYAYTQARIQTNVNSLSDGIYYTSGKSLINTPRNTANVSVNYNEGPFWASLNAQYSSSIWGDWSNTEKVGGYTTFNLNAGWKFNDFSSWFTKPYIKLNVFNLTDRKALTFATSNSFLASNPSGTKDINGTTLFSSTPFYSLLERRSFMVTFGASFF